MKTRETLADSATMSLSVENCRNRPLRFQNQRLKATGKVSREGNFSEAVVLLEKRWQRRCRNQNSGSNFGHPPECQHYTAQSRCKLSGKCVFMHREVDSQPKKKPKKTGGKGSVAV